MYCLTHLKQWGLFNTQVNDFKLTVNKKAPVQLVIKHTFICR